MAIGRKVHRSDVREEAEGKKNSPSILALVSPCDCAGHFVMYIDNGRKKNNRKWNNR